MNINVELWGAHTGNSLRAAIALEEAGVAYSVRRVDLRGGEQRTPEFLALNPAAQVPVLVETSDQGRLILPQSNAIMFYAAARSNGDLLPEAGNTEYFAVLERFFYFLTDVIGFSATGFFLKSREIPGGDALYAQVIDRAAQAERFLAASDYMASDKFSIADIAAFTIIWAFRERMDWPNVPQLHEWYQRVLARPAVQRGLHAFSRRSVNQ